MRVKLCPDELMVESSEIKQIVPAIVFPAELASELGCSERKIRRLARGLGACRIFGKTMVLLPEDVEAIFEAARPCPSPSIAGVKSGTTAEPLPDGSYEDLV